MFCLSPKGVELLKDKFKSGEITPEKLNEMDSAQRHGYFASFLGEPAATKVNELVESKLLLKNQQQGLINAAKQLFGETHPATRDVVSRINRLEKVLTPESQDKFLSDLAAHKLGASVTMEQTAKIYDLSKEAADSKAILQKDPLNKEKMIDYGNKYLNLIDYAESLKPKGSPFTFTNIINLPKTALTSVLHFSAPFVQGWGMMTTKPFWKAFGNQFKYFASEDAYKDLNAYIFAHPDYKFAKDGKLGLTKLGDKLSDREEAIQSSLLEHVPVLKTVIKMSSRAFTGMLNDMRFGRFVDLLNSARLNDEDVSIGSPIVRDIAKAVNDFTGRGALGKNDRFSSIGPILNGVFFSPRKMSATMEMFNPVTYVNTSPTARMARLRQLSGSIIATGSMLTLAHLMGANVGLDPRKDDFMKFTFGKTSFDLTGGNASYLRLWARIITGQKVSASGHVTNLGERFGTPTREDVVIRYFQNKLAPTASIIADALSATHKHPFDIKKEAEDKFTPIVVHDFIELIKNDPDNAAAWVSSLSAVFGAQMDSKKK